VAREAAVAVVAALCVLSSGAAAADSDAVLAELKRLAERIEMLEVHNREWAKALDSDRLSEKEPELVTRLKAVEFQTLSMQKQARQIEALEGISVAANLTGVVQRVNAGGAATGQRESRTNYRGDITIALPGGEVGDVEGKIFTHFRLGQGNGVGLRPTYVSTPNTLAFQTAVNQPDDSFAILAQAWYQLNVPLPRGGHKPHSRERLELNAGKIDPFVFFDQNAAADDESLRFMNNAFVHNPLLDSGGDVGADAYGFSPGIRLAYVNEQAKPESWGASLGVFGSGPGANFSGSVSEPFVIGQIETSRRFFGGLAGNYRLYAWRNGRGQDYDGMQRSHSGIGLSADQRVGDALTLFGRYGHQLSGNVRFDRALTLGGEIGGQYWSRSADGAGIAAGLLRTSGEFRRDSTTLDANGDGMPDFGFAASRSERVGELYYRFRVNKQFEITPDFQLIQRPGGDPGAKTVRMLGVRARVGI
jgi:hypothetical protein